MGKFIDLTGKNFGRLTVISRAENRHSHIYWKCLCACGNKTEVEGSCLKNGNTTSCGCYGAEQRLKSNTKHGLSHSRIKRIYANMHSRCENPNTPKYENHGGRGIKICNEWSGENGLVNFCNWAVANGYSDNLTIDRIDNNSDYCPQNCRWATVKEQNFNRRNNRLFTIGNETMSAEQWCKRYGVNINTFWQRDRKGLTGFDLVTPPKYKRNYRRI